MTVSLFNLFSVGIGPSSSHTVGPMRASNSFISILHKSQIFATTTRVMVELYGSLALTGVGHGTDKAILNGLEGQDPESVIPENMVPRAIAIVAEQCLNLDGSKKIKFSKQSDLLFLQKEMLPLHSNGMRFTAFSENGEILATEIYYSTGGGFIATAAELMQSTKDTTVKTNLFPYSFKKAKELLLLCRNNNLSIAELMLENEKILRSSIEIEQGILNIATIMESCIDKGCQTPGILPGGLLVKRRAPELYQKLIAKKGVQSVFEQLDILNKLNLYAIAVNEENAAGGRIVTAPTNGAAGIIPAVLRYFQEAYNRRSTKDICIYFLTAAAIGILYKEGASISGAEVGCQGEIGVASSMAAAALTAVLGGSLEQIENAAEIAMEHHLGMTCDPVMGLVQIPCIERNAMGAVKAVNASRMALMGDGTHFISLDKVIRTMKETGKDMQSIYKETSLGGLAVNHPEC